MLPVLKTLAVACSRESALRVKFPPAPLLLPTLETLTLDKVFKWSNKLGVASFPALRTLTVALRKDKDILAMASSCPALTTLYIDVQYDDEFLPQRAFERLNYIPAVVIRNSDMDVKHLRPIIRAPRPYLELYYYERKDVWGGLGPINELFDRFAVHCTLSTSEETLRIICVDKQGNQRCLDFWETLEGLDALCPIWKHIRPSSVVRLELQPASLWRSVARTLTTASALETLSFGLSDAAELAEITHAPWAAGGHTAQPVFVSLITLYLRGLSLGPLRVRASDVSRAIAALALGHQLPFLYLDNVIVDHPSHLEPVAVIQVAQDGSQTFASTPP